jgi:hypothetical protein
MIHLNSKQINLPIAKSMICKEADNVYLFKMILKVFVLT